jgi:hypothetical protein
MGTLSKRTSGRRRAILKAIRNGHGFASAAAAVGISLTTFKDWRANDPEFHAECLDAAEFRDDVAEHALYTRGVHKGDTLALLAHLRAHRPGLYHRKMLVAVSGDPDSPAINVEHQHTVESRVRLVILPSNGRRSLTEEEIASERARIARENMVEFEIEGIAIPPDEADDTTEAA